MHPTAVAAATPSASANRASVRARARSVVVAARVVNPPQNPTVAMVATRVVIRPEAAAPRIAPATPDPTVLTTTVTASGLTPPLMAAPSIPARARAPSAPEAATTSHPLAPSPRPAPATPGDPSGSCLAGRPLVGRHRWVPKEARRGS